MAANPSPSDGAIRVHPAEIDGPYQNHAHAPPRTAATAPQEMKNFRRWFPWLMPLLVVVDVALFALTMYVNDCPGNSVSCVALFLKRFSFQPLKENPLLGPSSHTLEEMGALDVTKVVHKHQVWRLLTCMWLHAGVFHLLANMLSLLVIGVRLEQEFGFAHIGVLYVVSGFGGSLLSALFLQYNISVGASGAVFGLLGGMLSELITNWSIYANKCAALMTLLVIIALNLGMGILPQVDNFTHIGGFVTGFFLGFVFLVRPQFGWLRQKCSSPAYSSLADKPKYKTYQCVLWVLSTILLVLGLTLGLVLLLRGVDGNDHCSWCHYLSCVPTSRWRCHTQPVYCTAGVFLEIAIHWVWPILSVAHLCGGLDHFSIGLGPARPSLKCNYGRDFLRGVGLVQTSQTGEELVLSCSKNNRTATHMLQNATSSQVMSLCAQLCN